MERGPASTIAGVLALAAFAVAVVAGLAADNPAGTVLGRALAAMLAANLAGWPLGLVLERILADEHQRRDAVPAPVVPAHAPTPDSGPNVDGKK